VTSSAFRRTDGPRAALWATVAAGAVSAAAGAVAGVDGAPLGATVATGVVVLFFATGAVPLLLVGGETSRAGIGLLVLLMTYGLRLVGLLVALTVAARSGAVDVQWMALTLMACSLVFVGAAAALAGRSSTTL
jgi:hypothetical protein